MSLVRGLNYAVAGNQNVPPPRMHVSSNVYVKDGDAGFDGAKDSFRADPGTVPDARRLSVSIRTAVIVLGLVLTVMSVLILLNASSKARLSKQLSRMNEEIAQTVKNTRACSIELVSARDSERISYKAIHELGMIAQEGAETYYVTAPDTRPTSTTARDSLPGTYLASAGSR